MFELLISLVSCTEVNYCDNSTKCSNGSTCIDLPNGLRCLCQPGFEGATCSIKSISKFHPLTLWQTRNSILICQQFTKKLPIRNSFQSNFFSNNQVPCKTNPWSFDYSAYGPFRNHGFGFGFGSGYMAWPR